METQGQRGFKQELKESGIRRGLDLLDTKYIERRVVNRIPPPVVIAQRPGMLNGLANLRRNTRVGVYERRRPALAGGKTKS
jgi:hypothetical protein